MAWYIDLIIFLFAGLCVGAGYMYITQSPAVSALAEFEAIRRNQIRAKLRRFGGGLMCIVGACLIVGHLATRGPRPSAWSLLPWIIILLAVGVLMCLALVDLRLTQQLRRDYRGKPSDPPDNKP